MDTIDTYPVSFKFRPNIIFHDFRMRRNGIIKALTTELEDFIYECDPAKASMCLYGLPDGSWKVDETPEVVPHELPEPQPNINVHRDQMDRKEWLKAIAIHCDAWLVSLAFNYAFRSQFNKESREELFDMINSLPTVLAVITSTSNDENRQKRLEGIDLIRSAKRMGRVKGRCGVCKLHGSTSEGIWIMCDQCKNAFHDQCVPNHTCKP